MQADLLLDVKRLTKHFFVNKKIIQAVNEISFSIFQGEVLGLVGESGSGKSTIGRALMRLEEPTSGSVYFQERDILKFSPKSSKPSEQRCKSSFKTHTHRSTPG